MKKLNALNLGVSLNREEMKSIAGGLQTHCRRRSSNVVDVRPGGNPFGDVGYLNPFGCWIYPGMNQNEMP